MRKEGIKNRQNENKPDISPPIFYGNAVSDILGYMERLCRGRTGYEFIPKKKNALNLDALAGKLEECNIIIEANTPHLLIVKIDGTSVSVFASGKLIVKDIESKEKAELIAGALIKIIMR